MWIEDDQLKIFCELLSEVFIENYIEPSTEWTQLPSDELEQAEFDRFKKKRRQVEKERDPDRRGVGPLHFWFEDSGRISDTCFQQMADFLMPLGIIFDSIQLKKALLALHWMLMDHGCFIPKKIRVKLEEVGIVVDSVSLSERNKLHLIIQATAQAIGYHNDYFNVKKIKTVILRFGKEKPYIELSKLLHLDQWPCIRKFDASDSPKIEASSWDKDNAKSLEKLISAVNPRPKNQRSGRPPRTPKISKEIVLIPGIFREGNGYTKINFRKLRIVLTYLGLNLRICEDAFKSAGEHPVLRKYLERVPVFLHAILECWVMEGANIADSLNQHS